MRWLGPALILSVAGPGDGALAGELVVSGTQRLRLEWLDGQVRPGLARDDTILALRTTLRADYAAGPFTLTGEVRDSRVYEARPDSPVTSNDVNVLEPVVLQLRAAFPDALGPGRTLSVTAGRMMTGLGTNRLIDAPDFRNTTNALTGMRIDLALGGLAVEALWAMPQQRRPDDRESVRANRFALDREGLDRQIWGIDLVRLPAPGRPGIGLTYVGFAERDRPERPTRDRRLHSFGSRLFMPPAEGQIDLDAEAIVQFGRISADLSPDAPDLPVRAGFARAEAGYSFPGSWQPRVSLRYDWASGDRPGPSFGRFDRLLGSRVADFAASGLYAAIGRANISSPGLRLGVAREGTEAYVTARLLWADSASDSFSTSGVRDPTGRSGRYAGGQIEGRVRHAILPGRLRFDLNGALLLRDGLLTRAPNAPPGRRTLYLAPALVASF